MREIIFLNSLCGFFKRPTSLGFLQACLFHLTQLTQTLNRVDRMVAGRENDVAVTLNNLRQITDNLRDLSENAKRYPSGVIFGEPPKKDVRPR